MEATRVREFFDLYWSAPSFRGFDDLREVLCRPSSCAMSLVGDLKGKRVLEIGPGRGEDLVQFARSGGEVTGIEISNEALDTLRKYINKGDITLCKMDACNLGFATEVFDLVFANTCLMHLDRHGLFPQIWRVLKKRGRAIFVEPLKFNPFLLLYRCISSPGRLVSPSYFELREIEHLRTVFARVSYWEFYFFSPLLLVGGVILPPLKRFIPVIESLDGFLLRAFPPVRRLAWIVVMECVKE